MGNINGVKVLKHDLFTNDVLYTEVVFDMSSLKQELLPLVPLFWYDASAKFTQICTFYSTTIYWLSIFYFHCQLSNYFEAVYLMKK